MFQVVLQSVIRQLRSKLKLPAPPFERSEEKTPQEKNKDRTGFILALAIGIGGGILMLAMFSNLPNS